MLCQNTTMKKKPKKTKLQNEIDAKNKAYAFIIANGLMREFYYFCNLTQNLNAHELCVEMLTTE